eukprot:763451-Rhodomonas_salina.1
MEESKLLSLRRMVADYGAIPHARGGIDGRRSRRTEFVSAATTALLLLGTVAIASGAAATLMHQVGLPMRARQSSRSVLFGWTVDSDESDTAKISGEE